MSHLASTFAQQARACERLGSVMYAELLDAMAFDIDAAGVTARVLAGHERDPGPDAVALRLLGALHELVLSEELPDLARFYPSVGGHWSLEDAWPVVELSLADRLPDLSDALARAPQTNEIGRASALLGGLLHVARAHGLPVVLHEIGASAGLNLRADQFRYGWDDQWWGPATSPVSLVDAWRGTLPPVDVPLHVLERHGTDLAPIDPVSAAGRRRLMSYVWPDMAVRLERLRGALDLAAQAPASLAPAEALTAVRELSLTPGTTTVLWHSVMWQYLDESTRHAIEEHLEVLGGTASPHAPLAHLFLEPTRRTPDSDHEMLVVLRTWPDPSTTILGTAAPHGVPTTWE